MLDERFWAKVDVAGPCWEWRAAINASGYGKLGRQSGGVQKHYLAHRYAYTQLVGPIPEGLQLDHLCRNRLCVNPDHLEPVTHTENQRRGFSPTFRAARADECRHGHVYTAENTYRYVKDGVHHRRCRQCNADAQARRKARAAGR